MSDDDRALITALTQRVQLLEAEVVSLRSVVDQSRQWVQAFGRGPGRKIALMFGIEVAE